jgi:hypothetical protein
MRRLATANKQPSRACPACTEDVQCVACFLDMQQLARMEDDALMVMEGYGER